MRKTLLLLLFVSNVLVAQDTLYFANKNIIDGKVLKMSNYATRFSIFNNDSLQFDVRNKAIDSIKFANGKTLIPREISYLNKKPGSNRNYALPEYSATHVVYLDVLNLLTSTISVGYYYYLPNKRVVLDVNAKVRIATNEREFRDVALGFQLLSAEKRKSTFFLEPILGYIKQHDPYYYSNNYYESIYTQLIVGGNFYSGQHLLISPFIGITNYWGNERRFNLGIGDLTNIGIKLGYKIK